MAVSLITVADARRVLGKKTEDMTDQQIEDLLRLLRLLCDKSIEATVGKDYK